MLVETYVSVLIVALYVCYEHYRSNRAVVTRLGSRRCCEYREAENTDVGYLSITAESPNK